MSGVEGERTDADPDSRTMGELAVAFVALVRFTALTEIHGEVTAADTAGVLGEVTRTAFPGRLAVSRQIALSAGDVDLAVTPRGRIELRGLPEPVEVFEVDPCRHGAEWLTDPVCGMGLRASDGNG